MDESDKLGLRVDPGGIERWIGVGTTVLRSPSLRTGRAVLPHPAQDGIDCGNYAFQALPMIAACPLADCFTYFQYAFGSWPLFPRSKWYPKKSKPPACRHFLAGVNLTCGGLLLR
jgi:hypothetical protein